MPFEKTKNISFPPTIRKTLRQTGFSCLGRVNGQRGIKTLNSKSEECCLENQWYIILLELAYLKRMVTISRTFTTLCELPESSFAKLRLNCHW